VSRIRGLLSGTSDLRFGTDADRAAHAEAVNAERIRRARAHSIWTELDGSALVGRGPYLVHADTDELLSVYRGVVFQSHSAELVASMTPLWFYVTEAGYLVFLERKPGTWSAIVEKRSRPTAPRRGIRGATP
jgi:hypothetical protein